MQRLEPFNTLIAGHRNIKSIRNKFEMIAETIRNFDIFSISETKIDSTFPNIQLKISGFFWDVISCLPKMTWNLLRLSRKLLIFIYKNWKTCLL